MNHAQPRWGIPLKLSSDCPGGNVSRAHGLSGLGSTFRSLRDAFEERGEDELIDRRRGRLSARAADEAEAAWVAEMFRTRYFDVRIKHFHELIVGLPMGSVKPRWLHQGRRQR